MKIGTQDVIAVKAGAVNSPKGYVGSNLAYDLSGAANPVVLSASIDATGLLLTINLDMAVTGNAGFTLHADAGTPVLSAPGGSGSQITFACEQVYQGEMTTLDYAPGDVVSDPAGDPLLAFSGAAVVNNSTVPGTGPTVVFQALSADGSNIMQGVLEGVGGLTEARESSIWLPDYQGVYREFGAYEPGWSGGRVTGDVGSRVVYADDGASLLPEVPYVVHAPESTNYFLNSTAPVTQTISSLNGDHTFSCIGTGSVTLSGGATGVVSDGAPITADPAGADVICTVSGSPDSVQVEPGDFVSPPIPTTSVPVIRDACSLPFDSANWSEGEGTVYLEAKLSDDSLVFDGMLDVVSGFVGLTDGLGITNAAALVDGACQIGWVYSSGGMRLCVNGVWSATLPYDGGMLQGVLDIFRGSLSTQSMRNISIWSEADEGLIDNLMPAPVDWGNDFVVVVETATAGETFTAPFLNVGAYNANIDWGDGTPDSTITSSSDPDRTHAYDEPGRHIIRISGTCPGWGFNNGGDKLKLIAVLQFGDVGWLSFDDAFFGCTNLVVVASGTCNTAAVTLMVAMFRNCTGMTTLDLSGFSTIATNSMNGMFRDCSSLTHLDVSSFNTAAATSTTYMFEACTSLTTLDVSGFNTAKFTNLDSMFRECSSLTSLDVSNFDTTAVGSMVNMFNNCRSLTSLNLSSFNTAAVTTMLSMFIDCQSLTSLDLSGFDTAEVTTMSNMFRDCSSLTNLDVSSFSAAEIMSMASMFRSCDLVTSDSMDGFLSALYASRMATVWLAPSVDISPCNAPSGVYQDATPPTTGEEFRYKLENDPDGEGFNTWAITV